MPIRADTPHNTLMTTKTHFMPTVSAMNPPAVGPTMSEYEHCFLVSSCRTYRANDGSNQRTERIKRHGARSLSLREHVANTAPTDSNRSRTGPPGCNIARSAGSIVRPAYKPYPKNGMQLRILSLAKKRIPD